jgi:hypothetical protein
MDMTRQTWTRGAIGLVAGFILSWGCPGTACATDDSATPATVAPATVVRTYNISELVQPVPDYPLASFTSPQGGGGGGGGGPYGAPGVQSDPAQERPKQDRVDNLIKLLEELIDPTSWRDAGGQIGSLRALGTSLIVSQTEANQKQIQAVLDDVRRDQGTGVVIEVDARWLLLTPQQIATVEAASAAGKGAAIDGLKDDAALYCRAKTLGFNGQTVSVSSGRTTSVVQHATPVVGTGVALYDISTEREQSGASLQVTPRLAPDRQAIVIDVHSIVSEGQPASQTGATVSAVTAAIGSAGPATQPAGQGIAEATREAARAIDRPDRVEQVFRTTVRLAPATPAIIGGMTMEPGKAGSRQLYLVLSARASERGRGGE